MYHIKYYRSNVDGELEIHKCGEHYLWIDYCIENGGGYHFKAHNVLEPVKLLITATPLVTCLSIETAIIDSITICEGGEWEPLTTSEFFEMYENIKIYRG